VGRLGANGTVTENKTSSFRKWFDMGIAMLPKVAFLNLENVKFTNNQHKFEDLKKFSNPQNGF